ADQGDATYRLSARLARAAGEQGKFWPMHDRLLASARPPGAAELRRLVRGLGLNEEAFAIAIDSGAGAIDGAIQEDGHRAGALPVLATPSFIVNGRPVDGGSVAGAALRAAIDEELSAHKARLSPPAASPTPSAPQAGAEATAAAAPSLASGPAIAGAPVEAAHIAKAAAAAQARRAKPAAGIAAR